MDTLVEISAPVPDTKEVRQAFDEAFAEMGRINRLLSRHEPRSDVSRINKNAGIAPVKVSPETMAVLLASKRMWRLSGGAFDVTVGPLVELWDFASGKAKVPDSSLLDGAKKLVGSRYLILDRQKRTAMLAKPGMSIDLGGIGKGFAVDSAMKILARRGLKSAMVNAGASSIGVTGPRPGSKPWRVGLAHPTRSGELIGIVPLSNGTLSTSSFTQRYFIYKGKRYHHILHPKTGYPAAASRSVTVTAPTAMEGDALSTALFVLDAKASKALARRLPGVEFYKLDASGRAVRSSGFKLESEVVRRG